MKDGIKKYTSHRKGNREIITVSLPVVLVNLLESYANRKQISRSEVVSIAVGEYFYSKVGRGGIDHVEK